MREYTVGIIGAMDEEIALLRETMTGVESAEKLGTTFYRGMLAGSKGPEIVVARSGVCKVNAAICAQHLIDVYGVSALINTGIAGSLSGEIAIGDLVVSTDAVQHDVHAEVWGYAPGQIPRTETVSFPADEDLIALALESCEREVPAIRAHAGRVLSGDCFISDREKKDALRETYGGLCVEMEGAAIAQTACANGVPWVVLRAISDAADGSATVDYQTFEAQAIRHCSSLVLGMIRQMNKTPFEVRKERR